ncbi:hypothetical protein RJP21_18985 [Paenibacillus sp. VCA1]|uniref:hypothetical protein n=1 Tax=Paenibacillus sp. VCA1 TaxID=3039148 RepID=UPI0028716F1E|nr:hypothetical protein [Paenibacillus sp. VCA1]MDR9855703.1 hypothetical protein [Paenibacillus sp. VCA1]
MSLFACKKCGLKKIQLGKKEASASKQLKETEEKNTGKSGTPVPELFGDTAKADSALAKTGDGKFKTNALRFPTNIASLSSYLQSIAPKMNISITKRSPLLGTAEGGYYRFHALVLMPHIPKAQARIFRLKDKNRSMR